MITKAEIQELLKSTETYRVERTTSTGDMDKFQQDIGSDNVSKKIKFDQGIGQRMDVSGTPAFYIDGQKIDWNNQEGGAVIIDGKAVTWDSAQSGEQFTDLLLRIANVKQ